MTPIKYYNPNIIDIIVAKRFVATTLLTKSYRINTVDICVGFYQQSGQ
jgi:hypothetical protein